VIPMGDKYAAAAAEEDADDTPTATYGHLMTDYFSVPYPPSSSQMPDLTWSASEDSDGIMSPPTELDLYPAISALHISSPNRNRKGTSLSTTELLNGPLSFLPHAPPPVHERKRSLSPRNRERKERTYSSSDSDAPSIPRRPRPRYTSSFCSEVTPDIGCLSGF